VRREIQATCGSTLAAARKFGDVDGFPRDGHFGRPLWSVGAQAVIATATAVENVNDWSPPRPHSPRLSPPPFDARALVAATIRLFWIVRSQVHTPP
jgi:hypothetical protein